MKRILIGAALVVLALTSLARSGTREGWQWTPGDCPTGLHHQPEGPFAVVLFCEDSLGTYLAVVYIDPIGAPATQNGRWNLNDRFWHDAVWGSDVTGFKWSKDGTHLLVSTSPIYGSGGFFELEPQTRTARQRLPKGAAVSIDNPGPGYNISGSVLEEPKQ